MEMRYLYYILFFSLLYSDYIYEYKIKSFGIEVAECKMSVRDTLFNDKINTLLNFSVNTLNFFNTLYPVNNKYSIIINDEKSTIFFKKDTFQPKIVNSIQTEIRNNRIFYKNSDYEIPSQTLNIFSLLYILMEDSEQLNDIDNNLLEREGKFYSYSIFQDNDEYELKISPVDSNEGMIKHTDIFTWAIFKDNVDRYVSIKDNRIDKCTVKSGIINFTAEYIKK